MSDLYPAPSHARRRGRRAAAARDVSTGRGLRVRLRRTALIPALAATVIVGAVSAVCAGGAGQRVMAGTLTGAVVAWVATLVFAWRHADVTADEIHDHRQRLEDAAHGRLASLAKAVADGRDSVAQTMERVACGDRPEPFPPGPQQLTGDVLFDLHCTVVHAFSEASCAVAEAARYQPPQVEAFVSVARRLHALSTRVVTQLNEVQKQVETPSLLESLFRIDHLATRVRRHTESLAVLGGARGHTKAGSVPLGGLLRNAIAAIEHFSRAKVAGAMPTDVAIVGHAAGDVIHALAELIENATRFSSGTVELRAGLVAAGMAVEIDDRGGLPMTAEHMRHWNGVLSSPSEVDVWKQLEDGRIGLAVAALIAQRHDMSIILTTNHLGGVRATVILPPALLTQPQPLAPLTALPPAAVSRRPEPGADETASTRRLRPVTATPVAPAPVAPVAPAAPAAPAQVRAVPDGGARPPLPRRSESAQKEVAGGEVPPAAGPVAEVPPVVAQPVIPNLMGAFVAGVKSAHAGDPQSSPHAPAEPDQETEFRRADHYER